MLLPLFEKENPDVTLAPKETLFETGGAADRAYIVVSGSIELSVKFKSFSVILPGEIIGESFLAGKAAYENTAKAGPEGAKLHSIDSVRLRKLGKTNPGVVPEILKSIFGKFEDPEKGLVVHKGILENMSDGVMAIKMNGEVMTFNRAAGAILGAGSGEEFEGAAIDALFESIDSEANDEFIECIFHALKHHDVVFNEVVSFYRGEDKLVLSVATSFLEAEVDGELVPIGVIAVFRDITAVQKLIEAERELTGELKGKQEELQKAYMEMEGKNIQLQSALRKVAMIRRASFIVVTLVVVMIGYQAMSGGGDPAEMSEQIAVSFDTETTRQTTVEKGSITHALALTGKLEPLKIENVISPVDGNIKEINFRYGEFVSEGAGLTSISSPKLDVKLREARSKFIKAKNKYDEVRDWINSPDVASAGRSLTKAKIALANAKKNFDVTAGLYKKDIVSRTEYDSAKQQMEDRKMDLIAAQEQHEGAMAKGDNKNVEIAENELEIARTQLDELESLAGQSRVNAPLSGVVMKPAGYNSKPLEKGSPVKTGELIISIGDLTGFSVKVHVDELEVTKIRTGQKVNVTGYAFPGVVLDGVVRSISSQARSEQSSYNRGAPMYEVVIVVEEISAEKKKGIFIGMSANLEIVIYEKPDALKLPVEAVTLAGGQGFVNRLKPSAEGEAAWEQVRVRTGYTTVDAVEILDGLKPGDVVVY